MSRLLKLFCGVVLLGVASCAAQVGTQPAEADKSAALDKFADQVVERLHQALDFAALGDAFVPDLARRFRDSPGDFIAFPTPRFSKSLLDTVDDAAIRRKLIADWNLHYLTSALLMAKTGAADATPEQMPKLLPPDFVKAARKSNYLKYFAGVPGQITLASQEELTEYLKEADQLLAVLRKSISADVFAAPAFRTAANAVRSRYGAPRLVRDIMGFDVVSAVAREAMLLVLVEKDGQLKLVIIAPVTD